MNSIKQAVKAYQEARGAAASGGAPDDHYNHGYWAARLGLWKEAIHAYHRALAFGVTKPEEVWLNIGSIYSERLQQLDKALEALNESLKLNPDYTAAMFNHGHLAEQYGDRDAAHDWFAQVLAREPDNLTALARLADATVFEHSDDPLLAQLRALAPTSNDPDVLLSLAAAEERLQHFDAAWQAMNAANAIDRQQAPPYPREKMAELNGLAKQIAIPAAESQQNEVGGPVFICGMFRTGSTLLEQLLAAHGAFYPLGESDFWPRRIAAAGGGMVFPAREASADEASKWRADHQQMLSALVPADKIATDKRPDNIYQIHLLGQLLPTARFVITRRDWRDTLVSVFGTRLHPQHGYANDVRATRAQIRLVDDLADTWAARYPDRVRVVSYEDLVENTQDTLGSLLGWLGQPWRDAALDFHALRNSVRTASVWQVREPLHGKRQARWRRFEQPLREVFGDSLDEPRA